jgi:hypothetical protein
MTTNNDNIERLTEEYLVHANHLKQLEKIVASLKAELSAAVEAEGDTDEKGHQFLNAGKYLLQRQRRQGKQKLNISKAEEWAKDRGIWEEVSRVERVLDEYALTGYIYEHRNKDGLEEEFQSLHDPAPVTYAFVAPVEETQYDY